MAITSKDSLSGELEVVGRPQALQWGKPWEFIQVLKSVLRVRFPVAKGVDFIVAGPDTPGPSDSDKMWAKFDRSRNPGGWKAFIKGKWQNFYTPVPGQVVWIIGNSENVPAGWQLIDEQIQGLNAQILQRIKGQYVETGVGSGVYSYYAARYIGY